ncbi:hypothetical protein WJX72_009829 [[Myrmecia] bisecta]|uniref:Glutamate--cysteine ligase n=1 Tax=[Myrmecia] bisecta TaxID=41462 RepID=A0AAW1PEM5_9CHLO
MLNTRQLQLHTQAGALRGRLALTSQHALRRPKHRRVTTRTVATTAQAVKPLTKTELVQFLASGCKPASQWRIGTEHEKLGYNVKDKSRLTYDQIAQLLNGLCTRFGWTPIMEAGNIIGATLDGQSVTIEPGGQFELSGAPVDTLHKTCSEVNSHLYQVKTIAAEMGVAFLGLGFDPKWRVADVPIMPKQRYRIMREYMPTRGTLGHDMMFRSCTIQVNIDFEDERDMAEKMRIGMALQPIATALFANSPFRDGKPTGFLSWRSQVWTDVDPDRCGMLPFVFNEDFGFEDYVEYALDVPMYFVYRDGNYTQATGSSFRDFMHGRLSVLPGEYPTLKDWEMHLTTIFPEVRLKRYMEMRGADGGPWNIICALPAFWVGILYNKEAQAAALDMIKDWSAAECKALRDAVPKTALKTKFRDTTVQELAKQALAISRAGLDARGNSEATFLQPLEQIAESGVTQAERLLEKYEHEWQRDLGHVYTQEFTY